MKWPRYPGGRWVGLEIKSRVDILRWHRPEIYNTQFGPIYFAFGPVQLWISAAVEHKR